MTDAVLIERKTGSVLNESTGQYADTWETVYVGRCRVQEWGQTSSGTAAEAGVRTSELQQWGLFLPMSVMGVQVDDRATITASSLDPELVSRVLRVKDLYHKSQSTARRLAVEEVTSG
jgi:uncharacterized protein DUF6093